MDPLAQIKKTTVMLSKVGLNEPKRPDEIAPDFPDNLADLTLKELSEYLMKFTSWWAYSAWLESMAKIEMVGYDNAGEYYESVAYITSSGGTTDKRKAAIASESVLKEKEKYLEAHARYQLISSLTNRYAKYTDMISRQVSILQLEQKII